LITALIEKIYLYKTNTMNIKTLYKFSAILLVAVIFLACKTFYKANSFNPASSARTVDSLKNSNRYFILRNGEESFYIKNLQLSADKKTARCILDSLPVYHRLHLTKGLNGKMRYRRDNPTNAEVINEVHFYMPKDTNAALGNYTLHLDKINKIEVLQHDKKRTTNSYVLGAVGYTVGAMIVAGLIILATKSSCPFVAAYDGNDFSLQGEIYGGAIYPQLSRLDYLPLKMTPLTDGSLQIKITNELKEKQFTDFARLWKITHPQKSKIMTDEKGNLFSITDPQSPVAATLNGNKDVLPALLKSADYNLIYMDDSSKADALNEVFLKFKKPVNTEKSKLVLSIKNSYWLDLLYGELAKGFGKYYSTYMNQQKKKPAEELLKWVKEQQLPLAISVKTDNGWQKAVSITTIGPLAFRETAVEVDLSAVNSDEVEIKLSSGFMFC